MRATSLGWSRSQACSSRAAISTTPWCARSATTASRRWPAKGLMGSLRSLGMSVSSTRDFASWREMPRNTVWAQGAASATTRSACSGSPNQWPIRDTTSASR